MSNVMINIASEFDSKGFKKAQSSTSALEKQANKLGKALLAAFSAQKVLQYSKASVLAYANDRKSAALLANQLKNLGLAYAAVDIEKFISNMEQTTGIVDDELRPAFSNLVRVTNDANKAQELMSLAFDASRGSGVDFAKTIDILSKAYVGNNKGLRSLNLGLTQAEMKTVKFDEVVARITKQFKGAGAASLNTYAGKIDLLKLSLDNAQETVGKGIVDAFSILAKDNNFNAVVEGIGNMALYTADTVRGIGKLLDSVNRNTPAWLKNLVGSANVRMIPVIGSYIDALNKAGRSSVTMGANLGSPASWRAANKAILENAKKLKVLEDARLKTLREQAAAKKLAQTIDKAQLMLNTAKDVFDLERISVTAALANTTLTENERKRLELKQAIFALEDAIDSKDQKRIDTAMKTVGVLGNQLAVLQLQDSTIGGLKSALDALGTNKDLINLDNLSQAITKLQEMNLLLNGTKTPSVANNIYSPTLSADIYTKTAKTTFGSVGATPFTQGMSLAGAGQWIGDEYAKLNAAAAAIAPGHLGINLIVTDNAKNLVDIVMETVTEQSASGNPPIVTRVGQNLAW